MDTHWFVLIFVLCWVCMTLGFRGIFMDETEMGRKGMVFLSHILVHSPFLTFFLSLGGSFRALIMRADALGTTSTVAWRFLMVSLHVIFRPFQSPVALAISSPTFFGDRPRGPTLGARVEVAPTSPPTALRYTVTQTISLVTDVTSHKL